MYGTNRNLSRGARMIGRIGMLALLAATTALAQASGPASSPAGNAPAGAGQVKNVNEKLVTPIDKIDGTYAVDLVLPAWTVHNYLTLCSKDNKLTGSLREQGDSKFLNNLTDAALNNSGFVFHVQVGPGGLDFAGSADGKTITGRVTIDGRFSEFRGLRANKTFDCTGNN
jgi:hypothetical protein